MVGASRDHRGEWRRAPLVLWDRSAKASHQLRRSVRSDPFEARWGCDTVPQNIDLTHVTTGLFRAGSSRKTLPFMIMTEDVPCSAGLHLKFSGVGRFAATAATARKREGASSARRNAILPPRETPVANTRPGSMPSSLTSLSTIAVKNPRSSILSLFAL